MRNAWWENSKIIATNPHYHQSCLEAWHINCAYAPLNRSDGGLLPEVNFDEVIIGPWGQKFGIRFVWYVNNSTAYVTLHNDLLGNQVRYSIAQKICWFNASGYIHMHSFKWLCSTTSVIFLISKKVIMQCDVCGGIIYIYIKLIQISQDWNEIRDSCKDQYL